MEAQGARSGGGVARCREIDAITAADYECARQLIGKAEARLNSPMKGVIVVAVFGAGEHLDAVQSRVSRYRRRWLIVRNSNGIQQIHQVVAFSTRNGQ